MFPYAAIDTSTELTHKLNIVIQKIEVPSGNLRIHHMASPGLTDTVQIFRFSLIMYNSFKVYGEASGAISMKTDSRFNRVYLLRQCNNDFGESNAKFA